jgi:hypothetical protein
MSVIKLFIFSLLIILSFLKTAFARDCAGDMLLWQSPNAIKSDCSCSANKKMLSDLSMKGYRFGKCQETYNLAPDPNYPLKFPGLVLWFDADDPYGNGYRPPINSLIYTWFDKSGSDNHAYACCGYAGAPATYAIFNQTTSFNSIVTGPALRFNGSTFYSVTNSNFINNNYNYNGTNYSNYQGGVTIFMVISNTGAATGTGLGIITKRTAAGTGGWTIMTVPAVNRGYDYALSTNDSGSALFTHNLAGTTNNQPNNVILTAQATAARTQLYVNYVNNFTSNQNGTGVGFSSNTAPVIIGASYNLSNYFTGFISEIIVYYTPNGQTAMNVTQISSIMDYLGQKWNLYK